MWHIQDISYPHEEKLLNSSLSFWSVDINKPDIFQRCEISERDSEFKRNAEFMGYGAASAHQQSFTYTF